MSQMGHSCERFLWYTFRWCYRSFIPVRINRLFERGHREEEALIEMLEEVGIKVWNRQNEVVSIHGHSKGHCDGECIGVIEAPKTVHVLELKTMNDKYFKEVKKNGVEKSKPVYYGQAQLYMKHFNRKRTLFVGSNKNDDDVLVERLYYDRGYADNLEERGESIILSERPPKRRYKPTWYECKFCEAKDICHGGEQVHKTCRTCDYMDILPGGKWSCNRCEIELTTSQQRIGCDHYKLIEAL
jgi:hypothetical protein